MTKTDRKATFVRLGLIAGASGLALAVAAPAFADDTPAAPATNANSATAEIIVTAQFRAQKLQDTPISITAVNAAMLEARNENSLAQIANQAPNVQLTPMGGAFGNEMAVYIRGVGQYDFNPAYEPGVGIYVDDVYYSSLTGNILDLLDLDRVEVLRGPQGTLTGRNSEGGAIKLFSIKPEETDSGSVEATYGSRNLVDLRAMANFKLADGLSMRVSGVYKRQDGYVNELDYGCAVPNNALGIGAHPGVSQGCVVAKLGGTDYTGLRGTLRYHPNDKLDWLITGDYTYSNQTNAAGVLTHDNTALSDGVNFMCGRFCTYASWYLPAGGSVGTSYTLPDTTMFTSWDAASNLTYNFTDTLKGQLITAYRKWHETFGTDDDYTPDPNIGGGGYNDLHYHFFSQEARLSGNFGSFAEFTVGAFFDTQKTVYFTQQDIRYIAHSYGNTPLLYLQFQGNDPVNAHSEAGFGTVILHPTSALTITGGLRYTSEHKDYTFVRLGIDGGPLADPFGVYLLNGVTAAYNGRKLDYRVSADYRFNPQVLAYATVSTGFKGGGVTARPFTRGQALNGDFSPETLTNFEVGLKTDLFDRKLRVNVDGFYDKYNNIQLPIIDCSRLDGLPSGTDPFPCAAVANAGNGHTEGFEAEVTAHPIPGVQFDGALSYLTGKFTSISAAVLGPIQPGDPDYDAPQWKASAGLQYKAELGNNDTLTPRIDMSYTSKQSNGRLTNSSPLEYTQAYALANAHLMWYKDSERLTISFDVMNLFNRYYFLPIPFTALYSDTGTSYQTVGQPRQWSLTIRKKF